MISSGLANAILLVIVIAVLAYAMLAAIYRLIIGVGAHTVRAAARIAEEERQRVRTHRTSGE